MRMTLEDKIELLYQSRLFVRGWTAQMYLCPDSIHKNHIKDIKICFRNRKPVGWGMVLVRDLHLYVKPIFRKNGIAKQLIRHFGKKFVLRRNYPIFGESIPIVRKKP